MKKSKITLSMLVSLIASIVVGCTSDPPKQLDGMDFLEQLKKQHLVINQSQTKTDVVVDSVSRRLPNDGIVYISNVACSICIGELLEFADKYVEMNCKDSLYFVVEDQGMQKIEFYLEKSGMTGYNTKVIKNNSLFCVKDFQNENETVLLLHGGKIAKVYKYLHE